MVLRTAIVHSGVENNAFINLLNDARMGISMQPQNAKELLVHNVNPGRVYKALLACNIELVVLPGSTHPVHQRNSCHDPERTTSSSTL